VINVDGTGETQIKDQCLGPSWSPDGERIAYSGIGARPDNMTGHLLLMAPGHDYARPTGAGWLS